MMILLLAAVVTTDFVIPDIRGLPNSNGGCRGRPSFNSKILPLKVMI